MVDFSYFDVLELSDGWISQGWRHKKTLTQVGFSSYLRRG